jgi:AcrR family transcriptional regulator
MSIKIDCTDRRIVKSKKAMRAAVISLMLEKGFNEISVTDIVRVADLNRGTFYKHYQYPEDILNEMIDEVITDLTESFREPYKGIEVFEVNKLTTSAITLFDHVSKYADFYTLIFQTNNLVGFQHQFCTVIKDLALKDLHTNPAHSKINRELHASYQAYAILGLIREWLMGGFQYSSRYMAEQLLEIIKLNQSQSVFTLHTAHS